MTTAEVYLPCDVSQVRVKLGFGDTLSPLEEAALRVIAEFSSPGPEDVPGDMRRADVREVATLLGLGYRVVLDLVHDLWRAGYLVVDFASNSISLSADVQKALEAGQLSNLRGTEAEERTVELMVERLTGYVMPSRGPFVPANQQMAVRFLEEESGVTDASQANIQQALRSWLSQRRGGRQHRILSVRSAPSDRSTQTGRRWYPLTIQAELNPDSDRLVITVADRHFPADRRDRAADRLTRLAEENPQDSWVTQLRNKAEQLRPTPPPVEELIDRLDRRIAEGTGLPAGRRRAEHLEWANETRRIAGLIQDRIAHEAEIEPVHGGAAHTKVVRQLIGEARTQLILTCPRIVDYALREFRDQLQDAIDRGVQIVILWGGEYKSTLQANVSNELDSLARRAKAAPVLRAQVSANTSARMVICDNRATLVTSRDFLATTRDRPEIGLLLRSPTGQEGATLTDLLRWTRVNVPGSTSASVLRTADRFDASAEHPDQPAVIQRENLPEEPPEDPENTGAVQAWTMRWQAHLAGMRSELASRPLPALRLVEDGTHRELLWEALRNAQRRLVIASGQVSDEVVSSRMIDALATLLERGVCVTIGYDEQGGADRGRGAVAALRDLASSYPTLFTLTGATGHTRVLVWDDDVTIGSYSYLFHAGYGTVGGRHMLPSELSVRFRDPELARRVAAECGEPTEAAAQVADVMLTPAATQETDPAALGVAQHILNRAGELPPGELIPGELEDVPDPWPVLDLLERLAEPGVRRAAIAYCLAHKNPDALTATLWRQRLIAQLVRDGLFMEARILRAGAPGDPDGQHARPAPAPDAHPASGPAGAGGEGALRSEILDALSKHGRPGSGDVLLEAAFQDLADDERSALLIICVGDLLKSGSDDARNALEVLPGQDGPWDDLVRLATEYHGDATAAPTAELMRDVARQQHIDTWLIAAWGRLEIALIEAEPLPKALDGARKTKAALFKDSGIFGRLRAISDRHDLQALRAFVAAEFPGRPSPSDIAGDILDRTWREVAPLTDLLDGRPRIKYIKRLGGVVAAARDVALAGDQADGRLADGEATRWHPKLLAAAGTLVEGYQRLRPMLGDTSGLGPLAAAAAREVLSDLDLLMSGLAVEPELIEAADPVDDQAESTPGDVGSEPAVLVQWNGLWQYPDLALALWAGEADPVRIAALLMPGLVDPMPAARTGRELIKAGEFAAVEALRAQAGLTNEDSAALLRELHDAQSRIGSRARYEAAALTRRASRAELGTTLSPEAVGEQAQRRWPAAKRVLAEFRDRITTAEDVLAAKLRAEVDADQAVLDGVDSVTGADAETIDRWRRTVLACVEAREFPSARRVLSQRPGEAYIPDPHSYAPPRPVWPFPADILESVLSWYFTQDLPDTPVRFSSWQPPREDTDGWELLEALRAHVLEPTARSAALLRDRLQRLVGVRHQGGLMTLVDGGWAGWLFLPGGPQLPPFSLLSRHGITLWIAASRMPPPGHDGKIVAWLVTDLGPPAAAPAGTTIIDPLFLFRLLAPGESGTADPEARLVNVVRHLAAQLDVAQLAGDSQPGSPPFSESDVGWFLDVLGASSDGVTAEALHYDTGGRVEVLLPLLSEALPSAVPGRGRFHPLDAAALSETWNDGAWRGAAIDGLLAPLHGGSTVLAVAHSLLWVAAMFHEDAFSLTDLATDVMLVATGEQAAALLPAADLEGAVRELHRLNLFELTPDDRWRLPPNGIRELLGGTWPGHDTEQRAREAIGAWFRHHEREGALRRAVLSDDVVRMIGHLIANRMAALRSALDAGEYAVAGQIAAKYDDIHEMYRNALEDEAVLALRQVLSNCKNESEYLNPTRFQVTVPAEEDLTGLHVAANQWLLEHAFQNLLDNARLAGEKKGLQVGKVRITVAVTELEPGAEGVCRIDIEDNGTGFDPHILAQLEAGEECTTWNGRGTGVHTAARWFREYRGNLEIMPGQSALGGARVRVTLPLTAPEPSPRDG